MARRWGRTAGHDRGARQGGGRSLAWEWSAGDRLVFADAAAFETAAGFSAWIYNAVPARGSLRFRFGLEDKLDGGEVPFAFEYPLSFSGWRHCLVSFREDVAVPGFAGEPTVTAMSIEAPADGSGRICLDLVDFPAVVLWSRGADRQLPWLNPLRDFGWYLRFDDLALAATPERAATETERSDLRAIEERYRGWLLGEGLDWADPLAASRLEAFLALAGQSWAALEGLSAQPLVDLNGVRAALRHLGVMSVAYHLDAPGNRLHRAPEVRDAILAGLRHVIEQGFAAGSLFDDTRVFTLSTGGLEPTLLLMKDELRAAGMLDEVRAMVRWYSGIGRTVEETHHEGMDADTIRGRYLLMLAWVLSLDQTDEQAMWLRHLSGWMSRGLLPAPKLGGTIKPDFTGFHHAMIVGNSYVIDALHAGAAAQHLLHGTQFALSEPAAKSLRNALLAARFYANTYDVPTMLALRWPFATDQFAGLIPAYAYLALADDSPDGQMQRVFARLWRPSVAGLAARALPVGVGYSHVATLGAVKAVGDAAALDTPPEPAPEGFRFFPYGALAVHRRGEWMVATKGWSRYIANYEQASNRNIYGRYTSHGTTEIYCAGDPVSREASGYLEPGWDWNRWPGATAIYLPWNLLYGKSQYRDPCPYGRLRNEETFVGAVSHLGRHGMFAMQLSDPHHAPAFRARKSCFYVEDTIVCLGTGITNDDPEHPVETTLFQLGLPAIDTPTWINSTEPTTQFPLQWSADGAGPAWLVDHVGNGYYLPDASSLRVARHEQDTPWNGTLGSSTKGNFEVAWLDHGPAPADASYEYAIRVQTSPAAMAAYALAPGYEVLRADERAHIVRDRATGITGYALFEAGEVAGDALVAAVEAPCLLMAQRSEAACILSVCDPDLGWTDELDRSPERIVRVTLRGQWRLDANAQVRIVGAAGGRTVVEVACGDGRTVEARLVGAEPAG
ncbi:MAG: chondroitinase family polysaccharide lyase [Armatimonadota bacterium]